MNCLMFAQRTSPCCRCATPIYRRFCKKPDDELEVLNKEVAPKRPKNFVEAFDIQNYEREIPMNKIKRGLAFHEKTFNDVVPFETDFLIIGGGMIGSSIAYWLKRRLMNSVKLCVLDRDPAYEKCAILRSAGGIRQQFSLQENIEMSMFSANFLSEYKYYLGDDAPDPKFKPEGCMFLADSDASAQKLENNIKLQVSLGAKIEALTPGMLKRRYPFMNVDDIKMASYGLRNEGWFDPWSLLQGMKQYNLRNQTSYIFGEAVDFRFRVEDRIEDKVGVGGVYEPSNHIIVRLPDGELRQIIFAFLIIAAGADSGHIGRLLRMGIYPEILSVPIPVEPRKRPIYTFHAPDIPSMNFPYVIDPSGTYCRPEGQGGYFLCGRTPKPSEEVLEDNGVDFTDHDYFMENVWPSVTSRIPAFGECTPQSLWAGDYDYNYFDESPIIDYHPYYHNVTLCTGFSGRGAQMAPAAGRAMVERILDGKFVNIDLSRLNFQRVYDGQPIYERGIN